MAHDLDACADQGGVKIRLRPLPQLVQVADALLASRDALVAHAAPIEDPQSQIRG